MSVQSRNVGANASCYDAAGRGLGGCSRRSRRRPRSFHYGKLSERLEDGRKKTKTNDVRFRCMSINVGTMRGRGAEIVETSDRRKANLGLLQETRWKGSNCPKESHSQVRWIKGKASKSKFFWSGNSKGTNGVGILLAQKWAKSVFDVQRPSDRIIVLKLIIGKTVYAFVSVYAPQSGRPAAEKDLFYDQLNAVVAKIPLSEVLIPGGDWNGHVGSTAAGFEEVHGGFGYGERNEEGGRILDFAVAHDLIIGNTWFKKRLNHLITYESGDHSTQIDFILFRRSLRKLIQDVKVIPGEECFPQHRLLVLDFKMSVPPTPKRKFVPRLRTWKLSDPSCSDEFGKAFCKACGNHKEVDHCKKCGIQIECTFCGAHKEPLCVACLQMETE